MIAHRFSQFLTKTRPLKTKPNFVQSPKSIAKAYELSRATVRNMRQNLALAFLYNTLSIPIAAGVLYPFTGLLLSPMIAALAMSFSSVSVIYNALRLRKNSIFLL